MFALSLELKSDALLVECVAQQDGALSAFGGMLLTSETRYTSIFPNSFPFLQQGLVFFAYLIN